MREDNFYKNKYFEELTTKIDSLTDKVMDLHTDLDGLRGKMKYIYGFAAGVGLFSSLVITWIRSKL